MTTEIELPSITAKNTDETKTDVIEISSEKLGEMLKDEYYNNDTGEYVYTETDANGKEYTYRLVEKVVGSYKVEGALVDSSGDGKVQLVAVGVGTNAPGASCQTFTNALNTVDISGTKRFNDYGTGLAPTTLDQVQSSVKL